jgi:putative ATPase
MLAEEPDTLTFSPGDKERDRWIRRVQGTSSSRKKLLKALTEPMQVSRSDRILLAPLRWNQLFWELFRKVPEGGLTALADREDYRNFVEFSMESLPESERPALVNGSLRDPDWLDRPEFQSLTWEHILLDGVLEQQGELLPLILGKKLAAQGWITGCLPLPGTGSRLSDVLKGRVDDKLFARIQEGEELFYTERAPLPQREQLEHLTHLRLVEWTVFPIEEPLSPNAQWLAPWIKDQPGSWFSYISRELYADESRAIRALLQPERLPSPLSWTRNWLIYRLQKTDGFVETSPH